jgi:hypothetical protein
MAAVRTVAPYFASTALSVGPDVGREGPPGEAESLSSETVAAGRPEISCDVQAVRKKRWLENNAKEIPAHIARFIFYP